LGSWQQIQLLTLPGPGYNITRCAATLPHHTTRPANPHTCTSKPKTPLSMLWPHPHGPIPRSSSGSSHNITRSKREGKNGYKSLWETRTYNPNSAWNNAENEAEHKPRPTGGDGRTCGYIFRQNIIHMQPHMHSLYKGTHSNMYTAGSTNNPTDGAWIIRPEGCYNPQLTHTT
jgi:hypothetical protein